MQTKRAAIKAHYRNDFVGFAHARILRFFVAGQIGCANTICIIPRSSYVIFDLRSGRNGPRDPILGLNEAFNADARSTKVNLGVGVYFDDNGKIPLLAAVKAAEDARVKAALPRGYQPIEGSPAYNQAVQNLLLGKESPLIAGGQVITAQALGGTGALKIGADYLKRLNPDAKVYISDPSWENHRALFESAGFVVESYPYYDAATRGVNFDGMKACLNGLPAGSIILLHACCHNPTGADLSDAQWGEIVAICQNRGLVPFLDMAYQGFADGIDADAVAVRAFSVSGLQFFASSSFSKTFRCMASALVRSPSLPPARMNRLGSCRS
jgi:aromatic-amino-acid transaminase